MKKILLILLMFVFFSCNVCRIAYKFDCCNTVDTVIGYDTVIIHSVDTTVLDSSKIILFLDCDSNKIYIRDTVRVGVRPTISVGLNNNILSITSKFKDTITFLEKEVIKYKNIYSSAQKEIDFYKSIKQNLEYKNKILTYVIFFITLFLLIIFIIVLITKKF